MFVVVVVVVAVVVAVVVVAVVVVAVAVAVVVAAAAVLHPAEFHRCCVMLVFVLLLSFVLLLGGFAAPLASPPTAQTTRTSVPKLLSAPCFLDGWGWPGVGLLFGLLAGFGGLGVQGSVPPEGIFRDRDGSADLTLLLFRFLRSFNQSLRATTGSRFGLGPGPQNHPPNCTELQPHPRKQKGSQTKTPQNQCYCCCCCCCCVAVAVVVAVADAVVHAVAVACFWCCCSCCSRCGGLMSIALLRWLLCFGVVCLKAPPTHFQRSA